MLVEYIMLDIRSRMVMTTARTTARTAARTTANALMTVVVLCAS
jgi:hypothetical protein